MLWRVKATLHELVFQSTASLQPSDQEAALSVSDHGTMSPVLFRFPQSKRSEIRRNNYHGKQYQSYDCTESPFSF